MSTIQSIKIWYTRNWCDIHHWMLMSALVCTFLMLKLFHVLVYDFAISILIYKWSHSVNLLWIFILIPSKENINHRAVYKTTFTIWKNLCITFSVSCFVWDKNAFAKISKIWNISLVLWSCYNRYLLIWNFVTDRYHQCIQSITLHKMIVLLFVVCIMAV